MKILAISINTSDPTPYISDEMRRITELEQAGVIEQLYLNADRSGAVIILEAPSARMPSASLRRSRRWSLAWRASM